MRRIKDYITYFTKEERLLWVSSVEVKVNRISRNEAIFMWILAAVVTVVSYFILAYFHTANIVPSTLSVTTSFVAVYLTFRRNPYFAVAYAANDVVLIVL